MVEAKMTRLSKILIGASIFIVVFPIVLIGAWGLYRHSKIEDRVGYRIKLESFGAKDVVLRVPAPYINGRLMSELIDEIKVDRQAGKQVDYSKRTVNTPYGKMLEIRIPNLSEEITLSGVLIDKGGRMVKSNRDINLWLNPYYINDSRVPFDKAKNIQFGLKGQEKTYVYSHFTGEPVQIEKLEFGAADDSFLGALYYGYYVRNVVLINDGWQVVELQTGGTTSY
ncbi:MAG: hypothetical protein AB1500_02850 [Bacillota bacterium]